MTDRLDWQDLPASLQEAVETRIGRVLKAESSTAGRNSAISASLRTADGWIFCKGIRADSPQVFMHHNEAIVGAFLPEHLAPRLLWQVEEDDWLLLGFEHVSGRHADFSPRSPDLPLVADAVQKISEIAAPPPDIAQRVIAKQWAAVMMFEIRADPPEGAHTWSVENATVLVEWAAQAPRHMQGPQLIHSDLNPLNILISDRAQVVDWAWWRTGAAWVDPAFLVVRLIAAGHEPAHAEAWADQFDGFRDARSEALTAFAASLLRMWERKFVGTDATNAARQWAQYRLGKHPHDVP